MAHRDNAVRQEVVEDKRIRGEWRVEGILPSGDVEVTIFSGANAKVRAELYHEWVSRKPKRSIHRGPSHLKLVKGPVDD